MRGITKRFGDLVANDHIDLTVEPGEVHALLGENGAGKSTLMNQLYGLLQPDEGEILVDGEPKTFRSPRDAIAAGIGMVHQHFMLVPVFTVAENIALGAEETRLGPLGWLDRRRSRRAVLATSAKYGLPVDPDALVENLPVGDVLSISGLMVDDDRGIRAVDGVDLVVRAGEVLGIAGVQGNGQTELVEAIMGLRPLRGGAIQLDNEDLGGMSTKQILRSGVGYVPEDRSLDGVVKEFSVAENLVLDTYDRPPYGNAFRLNNAAIAESARERVEQFDIRTSSPESAVSTLSGGNQQKVVVAREMSRPLRLFIAAQPTRGVDVGSIEFIHSRIVHERDVGTAVMVVSSELDEVVGLADRIAVMYRGKILAIVPPETPRAELGLLMAGITSSASDTEESAE